MAQGLDDRDTDVGESALFELLGNERRYGCLRILFDEPPDAELDIQDLADALADELADDPPATDDFRDSVYISLCQVHLPKLHATGITEYDSESKVIARGPSFEIVEPYLSADEGTESPPHYRYTYVLVSLLTIGLLLGIHVGQPLASTYGLVALGGLHVLVLVGLLRSVW